MSNAIARITSDDQIEAQATDLAPRVTAAFPKDCTPQQALEVARIALAYGLDPFLGELIPYQGKPHITIDGRVRIADAHVAFDGYDLIPATEAEVTALRCDANESVWKCTVYRKDRSRPTTAYGRAGGPSESNPVAKRWLPEIAQKRALHRALRAAFPVPIPGLEESLSPEQLRAIHAIDNEYGVGRDERRTVLSETFDVDTSADLTKDQASAYLDARTVQGGIEDALVIDTDTGEIFDAEDDGWRDFVDANDTDPPSERDLILEALPNLTDARDLAGYRSRISAAKLDDDKTVETAYKRAYKRLHGTTAASTPEQQPALPV